MRTLLIVIVMACCASAGCAPRQSLTVAGPKGASGDSELAIYELLARNVLADEPRDDIVLFSFGESWMDHVDPPQSFFERLADVQVSLKPVSQHDRLSNPNALLFVIRLHEWADDTEANAFVTRFRFGAGAADGFMATVQWTEGSWRLVRTRGHWST